MEVPRADTSWGASPPTDTADTLPVGTVPVLTVSSFMTHLSSPRDEVEEVVTIRVRVRSVMNVGRTHILLHNVGRQRAKVELMPMQSKYKIKKCQQEARTEEQDEAKD